MNIQSRTQNRKIRERNAKNQEHSCFKKKNY